MLLQDHRRTLYSHIFKNLIGNLSEQTCFKFGIYTPYTLLSELCAFHKDQTSTLDVLVV